MVIIISRKARKMKVGMKKYFHTAIISTCVLMFTGCSPTQVRWESAGTLVSLYHSRYQGIDYIMGIDITEVTTTDGVYTVHGKIQNAKRNGQVWLGYLGDDSYPYRLTIDGNRFAYPLRD